jgi:Short C-terminal domain
MPGLLRGIARTAVVAGTATAVSNRVSRRQANRWSQPDQQQASQYQEPQYQEPQYQAPPPAPAPTDTQSVIAQLQDLAKLRDQGILTDAELETQKARILGS